MFVDFIRVHKMITICILDKNENKVEIDIRSHVLLTENAQEGRWRNVDGKENDWIRAQQISESKEFEMVKI